MEFTKEEIINKKFKNALNGYNKAEVEVYLEWIGSEVEKLLAENAELKKKFIEMNEDFAKFSKEKEDFNQDQLKAKIEIERIKRDSVKYCDEIRLDARINAQNILKDSYIKAKELKKDIDKLREIKNSFIKRYQGYIKDQLETLKAFQKEDYHKEEK